MKDIREDSTCVSCGFGYYIPVYEKAKAGNTRGRCVGLKCNFCSEQYTREYLDRLWNENKKPTKEEMLQELETGVREMIDLVDKEEAIADLKAVINLLEEVLEEFKND